MLATRFASLTRQAAAKLAPTLRPLSLVRLLASISFFSESVPCYGALG